jgi:hypothetical protein
MGVMTFEEMQEEVIENLNFPRIGDKRPKRWINVAYNKICIDNFFEALKQRQTIPTVVGTAAYALTAGTVGIRAVKNVTAKHTAFLRRREQIYMWDTSDTDFRGEPVQWARDGDNIELRPIPDGVYSIEIWSWKKPTILTTASQVTLIPDHWDYAICLLATFLGSLAIPTERAGAQAWWQSFGAYTRSLPDEHDLVADAESIGVWVPQDESDVEGLEV